MVTNPGLKRSKHERILDTQFAEYLLPAGASIIAATIANSHISALGGNATTSQTQNGSVYLTQTL
jgi:hypothetical protein